MNNPKVTTSDIDAALPQTQCGECGYQGCKPYAEAILNKTAPIDRCPPGGKSTLLQLAALIEQDPSPYLTDIAQKTRPPMLAMIREEECIGCTKCIQACPVDAILGSAKHLHTVIRDECTGCGLCVAPCPVDCIDLLEIPKPRYQPDRARQRYHARHQRLVQASQARKDKHNQAKTLIPTDQKADHLAKQAYIRDALQRVQAKRKHKEKYHG